MSALASLQDEIEDLKLKLNKVTHERDELLLTKDGAGQLSEVDEAASSPELAMQCQRYEDRIVELHSVIAELSKKLEDQENDVIREESEYEESVVEETRSVVTDTEDEEYKGRVMCDEEDEDYTSLAFERDLDTHTRSLRSRRKEAGSSDGSKFSCEAIQREFEAEMANMERELLRVRMEAAEARSDLATRDREMEEMKMLTEQTTLERDNYRRQLQDIKATVEYQEAKMDTRVRSPSVPKISTGTPTRSSSERRSLRRRRHAANREASQSNLDSKVSGFFSFSDPLRTE